MKRYKRLTFPATMENSVDSPCNNSPFGFLVNEDDLKARRVTSKRVTLLCAVDLRAWLSLHTQI